MPIGELFDLEKLAAYCKEHKRYTFFLSSEPCNVSHKTSTKVQLLVTKEYSGTRRSGIASECISNILGLFR